MIDQLKVLATDENCILDLESSFISWLAYLPAWAHVQTSPRTSASNAYLSVYFVNVASARR